MNKSHIKKKKAFTLTELLVVVIVIGVLSAVVLPKFSKVMETRKTTEAEELMSAVRTEQEKRCTLDKSYLTSLTDVKDIVPAENSKNFAYSLTATGMEAQSKGKYGYTLKMPSYADGRICCENEAECAKLNKDYPLCSALIAQADYQSGAECAGIPPVIECTGSATQACGCKNGGTQTRTCDTSTGMWSAWSACSISSACSCTGTQPASSQECNGCGTQTRSVTCNTGNGEWNTGAWSACSKTEEECVEEQDCCSDSIPASEFANCILKQYGADSTEYVCATGMTIGSDASFGPITGAAACAQELVGFGSMVRAASNKCEPNDAYCHSLRTENQSWITSGFKKYACTGAKPNVLPRPSNPNPGTGESSFNCCRVELGERKTFRYSNLSGTVDCLNAGCIDRAMCPANIQPGVMMNGSHGGLSCTYSCSCPHTSYGVQAEGFVQKLKCVNYGDVCTNDQVEWL